MKTIFISVFSLFSISCYSQSNDRWEHIGDAQPGIGYYVTDINTSPNGVRSFWIKALELEDSTKKQKGEYAIVKWEVLCNSKEYKFGLYVEYDPQGKNLRSKDLNTPYKNTIPDSTSEKIVNFVCSKP